MVIITLLKNKLGVFKENLTNTVKWLHYNNLDIIEDNSTENVPVSSSFSDAIYICKILNSEIPNNFRIKRPDSSTQQITPKKHLLLYTIAHIFDCAIFVFSTRGKPCRILSIDKSLSDVCDKLAFGILQFILAKQIKMVPTILQNVSVRKIGYESIF
jgi:hypothetical protein